MSETPKPAWHGIPRENIQWHPTLITESCVGCGLCVTSCGKNVYSFDYETNKPVVAAPQACMVGCTTCAVLCTQDAIEFPSVGYVRQIIRKNKLVREGKDALRANVEKYDIKRREPAAA
jgi:NAD-dependent dihydropyrimidine dehydrogenase PreA subunit